MCLIGADEESTGSPQLSMLLSLAPELIQAISHEVSVESIDSEKGWSTDSLVS